MFGNDQLIILDADGTTVDAFSAINRVFLLNDIDIEDIKRFQNRRNIFKYLGGLKELPKYLHKQLRGHTLNEIVSTLTEVYGKEAQLHDGMQELINQLLAKDRLRVGVVTRNISNKPENTLKKLYKRCGVEVSEFDFFIHLPLSESKTPYFRDIRRKFNINPARAYVSGDEKKEYIAALDTGMHPFMVCYGFESYERLTERIGIPDELISHTPLELKERICNALDML